MSRLPLSPTLESERYGCVRPFVLDAYLADFSVLHSDSLLAFRVAQGDIVPFVELPFTPEVLTHLVQAPTA